MEVKLAFPDVTISCEIIFGNFQVPDRTEPEAIIVLTERTCNFVLKIKYYDVPDNEDTFEEEQEHAIVEILFPSPSAVPSLSPTKSASPSGAPSRAPTSGTTTLIVSTGSDNVSFLSHRFLSDIKLHSQSYASILPSPQITAGLVDVITQVLVP